jgi:hypothetical protein
LAENLVAAKKKKDAARVYAHLRDTRTDAKEKYVREAAEKALREALELDPSNRDIIAFLGTLEAKPKPVETAAVSGTAKAAGCRPITVCAAGA